MKGIFTGILNISISAGILIVVCIIIRMLFKNMPKFVRCLMWLLVAIRLAVPFSIESPFSMLPAKEYVTVDVSVTSSEQDYIYSLEHTVYKTEENALHYYTAEKQPIPSGVEGSRVAKSTDIMDILSIVWIIGAAVVLTYAFVAYIRLRRMVSDAVILRDNIYQSERVGSAFVLGLIRPRIYIPYGLSLKEIFMVVNHERAHISRKDHFAKPFGFIITAIYWFNPLVWIAYILLCRDIELACDEKVIKKIGYEKKKDYSQTLLNLSIPRKYIAACPVAFGEVGVGARVKNVLRMKKCRKAIIAVALAVCVVLAMGFLTYPSKTADEKKAEASNRLAEEMKMEDFSAIESVEPSEKVAAFELATEEAESSDGENSYVFYYNDYNSDGITNICITSVALGNVDVPHYVTLGDQKVVGVKTDDPNVYYTSKKGEVYSVILWPVLSEGVMEEKLDYPHDGTDINAKAGAMVVSVNSGTVEEIGVNAENAKYIVIKGDDSLIYTYTNVDDGSINVAVGDKVKAGDTISAVKSDDPVLNFKISDEYNMMLDPVMTEVP